MPCISKEVQGVYQCFTNKGDEKMGLNYADLDAITRQHMLEELNRDDNSCYKSSFLNTEGQRMWLDLLRESIAQHDDAWLEKQLIVHRMFNREYTQIRKGKRIRVSVPVTAPQTLAEGEFNYYYMRGLSKRATDEGILDLEIYRGKDVRNPRPESALKVGTFVNAQTVLIKLRGIVPQRAQGFVNFEQIFDIPNNGPNSGLTVRLAQTMVNSKKKKGP